MLERYLSQYLKWGQINPQVNLTPGLRIGPQTLSLGRTSQSLFIGTINSSEICVSNICLEHRA
jgi:hypothetical protein